MNDLQTIREQNNTDPNWSHHPIIDRDGQLFEDLGDGELIPFGDTATPLSLESTAADLYASLFDVLDIAINGSGDRTLEVVKRKLYGMVDSACELTKMISTI